MMTVISSSIIVMGVIGLMMALLTGALYRDLTLDSQRQSLKEFLQQESNVILQQLKQYSLQFGVRLQQEKSLEEAVKNKNWINTSKILQKQFNHSFLASDVIKLEKLYVFDDRLSLVAFGDAHDNSINGCSNYLLSLKNRRGKDKLKISDALCKINNQSIMFVVIPIGSPIPHAYLGVATDPIYSLMLVDTKINMPTQISLPNGEMIYQSKAWPKLSEINKKLIIKHTIKTDIKSEKVIQIEAAQDLNHLYHALNSAKYWVTLIASGITLIMIIIIWLTMQRFIIRPLQHLNEHAKLVSKDRDQLGVTVDVSGVIEVNELAANFNTMGEKLQILYNSLEDMAFTDALTNLANRKRFHDIFDQLLQLNKRQDIPFALMFIDLDKFKQINDTLGHQAGDQLLQEVSKRISNELRSSDTLLTPDTTNADQNTVARLGGDEFAILLPGIKNTAAAEIVAKKLISIIDVPFQLENEPHKVGMSIGISLYPSQGNDQSILVHRADIAMYHAKKTGVGYAIYDEKLEK